MKSPYDSYLMRKDKPKLIGWLAGKPIYYDDTVTLEQLRAMPLHMAVCVNVEGSELESIAKARDNVLHHKSERMLSEFKIDTTEADSDAHRAKCVNAQLDLERQGKITAFLVCVFFVLLVTL